MVRTKRKGPHKGVPGNDGIDGDIPDSGELVVNDPTHAITNDPPKIGKMDGLVPKDPRQQQELATGQPEEEDLLDLEGTEQQNDTTNIGARVLLGPQKRDARMPRPNGEERCLSRRIAEHPQEEEGSVSTLAQPGDYL